MLGSLEGLIAAHLDQRTLVQVNGIGYWVFTGSWQPEGNVTCYLHHHVREDMSDLYGFPDLPTLALFEKLLGVSGVGPKAALSILSLGSSLRIREAIDAQDTAFLSSASGIGQKAAQKIIVELHGKLDSFAFGGLTPTPHAELTAALEGLGYRSKEIQDTLRSLPAEVTGVDAQLKWALKSISSR